MLFLLNWFITSSVCHQQKETRQILIRQDYLPNKLKASIAFLRKQSERGKQNHSCENEAWLPTVGSGIQIINRDAPFLSLAEWTEFYNYQQLQTLRSTRVTEVTVDMMSKELRAPVNKHLKYREPNRQNKTMTCGQFNYLVHTGEVLNTTRPRRPQDPTVVDEGWILSLGKENLFYTLQVVGTSQLLHGSSNILDKTCEFRLMVHTVVVFRTKGMKTVSLFCCLSYLQRTLSLLATVRPVVRRQSNISKTQRVSDKLCFCCSAQTSGI